MSREFRRLAQEHGGRIYTFALHSLRSREDAEDVTQEVLIRLWRHRENIDPERVRAWVMRVARNIVIDVSRRGRIRASLFADGTDATAAEATVAAVSFPADHAERGELRRTLETAVAGLQEPQRSIVIMREIQGLSYREIADALEMPLGTVKVYLHRARRNLREQVTRVMGHDL